MFLDVRLLQSEINNNGDFKAFSEPWGGLALDTDYQSATFWGDFRLFPIYVSHLAQMLPKYSLFSTPIMMEMKFACLGMHCDVKDRIQLVKQIRWPMQMCLNVTVTHAMHAGIRISRIGNSKSPGISQVSVCKSTLQNSYLAEGSTRPTFKNSLYSVLYLLLSFIHLFFSLLWIK